MKQIYLIFCFGIQLINLYAQEVSKLNDFGRVALYPYVSEKSKLPEEAKTQLEIKLKQIASSYGMACSNTNPRFIITADISITTKDIIAGPPQQVSQNMDITLFVGDAIDNKIFSNIVISTNGVGTNVNKALIDAIKSINPKNKDIQSFIEDSKNKIINYYDTQCDFIIKDAETLAKRENFDEAIYKLALVPEVCKECYFKTADIIATLYQQKIDADCKSKLSKSKLIWSGQQNIKQAEEVIAIISEINPNASCYSATISFTNEITNKIKADEKARLELALKKYNDKMQLEKKRIDAYKEIAVEYAKNQSKTIIYNNIIWR